MKRFMATPSHVNLKMLAGHLGLSPATVSRALSGDAAISARTRQRVAAAAEQLGYRPNLSARRLATGRTNAIGLVFPLERLQLFESHLVDFLTGISEIVTRHNYDLVLSPFIDDEAAVLRRLAASRSVDGIIITGPLLQDWRIRLLHALDLPFVVHGQTEADLPYSFVDIDNEAVFAKAADLLLDLGHRRIATLNAPLELNFATARACGFRRALAARGLSPDPALTQEGPMSEARGQELARLLLDGPSPPTAIICGSIFLARGVYLALRERGLVPGRDLAVVAHDDLFRDFRASRFSPPLTATESSVRQAGERITEILIAQLHAKPGEAGPVQEIWPVELVFRSSAGPAPAT